MLARLSAKACLGAAVCALGAAGLMLPASALASHSHAKAHRAKAKGKKKHVNKGPSVTVRCASVSVTCKGKTGPAGPQGPAGPAGATGSAGVNGSNIVLQSQQTAPIELKLSTARIEQCEKEKVALICGVPAQMAPSSWTEASNEDDQLAGNATATIPSEAACGRENSGKTKLEPDVVIVVAEVDNEIEGIGELEGSSTQTTVTFPIAFDLGFLALEFDAEGGGAIAGTGFFLANGAPQPHTLSLLAEDECPEADAHATISAAAVDVLGTT